MKLKRNYLLLLFMFMFVLFTNITEANAMNTGFSTEELSKEKQDMFVSNIGITLLTMEPPKTTFRCYNVNDNGLLAIGNNSSDRKTICIYSREGVFQYGYKFNCSQSYAVEWDNKNLNVYFVRSDVIISLDSDGNILDIKKVQDTINNNTHRNDLLCSTSRSVGDNTYQIRNDMGILNWIASSYSQVIVKDATGTENIIYDVNSTQLFNTIATLAFVCGVVAFAIIIIVRQFIKLNAR